MMNLWRKMRPFYIHTLFFFFFGKARKIYFFIFIFIFWPCRVAYGTLTPQWGIELGPSAVRAWSPNHWTAREFPGKFKHKKMFSGLWPPLSPHCASCICIRHWPNLPHQQKYLLNHKEQHSLSVNKTTPRSAISFLDQLIFHWCVLSLLFFYKSV